MATIKSTITSETKKVETLVTLAHGPQGPAGAPGTTGKGFAVRGPWLPTTLYHTNDVVRYDNASWVCKTDNTQQAPTTNEFWELLASDGASDAYGVDYANEAYPELASVGAALDKLLFVPLGITSFTGGRVVEKGAVLTSLSLAWVLSKAVATLAIDQGVGALNPSLRTLDITGLNLTTDVDYTLTATKAVESDSKSVQVRFRSKRYWGVSALAMLTDVDVLALGSELHTARQQARTFDATGGKYLYVAYPASWGLATFKLGGLTFSAVQLTTRDVVNSQGYTESYHIYRTSTKQTGSAIILEVL